MGPQSEPWLPLLLILVGLIFATAILHRRDPVPCGATVDQDVNPVLLSANFPRTQIPATRVRCDVIESRDAHHFPDGHKLPVHASEFCVDGLGWRWKGEMYLYKFLSMGNSRHQHGLRCCDPDFTSERALPIELEPEEKIVVGSNVRHWYIVSQGFHFYI